MMGMSRARHHIHGMVTGAGALLHSCQSPWQGQGGVTSQHQHSDVTNADVFEYADNLELQSAAVLNYPLLFKVIAKIYHVSTVHHIYF